MIIILLLHFIKHQASTLRLHVCCNLNTTHSGVGWFYLFIVFSLFPEKPKPRSIFPSWCLLILIPHLHPQNCKYKICLTFYIDNEGCAHIPCFDKKISSRKWYSIQDHKTSNSNSAEWLVMQTAACFAYAFVEPRARRANIALHAFCIQLG